MRNFLYQTHENTFVALKTAQTHFQIITFFFFFFKDCWAIDFFSDGNQFTSLLGIHDVILGMAYFSVSRLVPLTGSQRRLVWDLAKLRWWKAQGEVKETLLKAAFDSIEPFPVVSRLLWEALGLFPVTYYSPFLPSMGFSLPHFVRLISACAQTAKFRSFWLLDTSGLWRRFWRHLKMFSGHSHFIRFPWEVWALSTPPEQTKLWMPPNFDINYKRELLRNLTRLSYLGMIYSELNRHSGQTWMLMLF